MGETVTRRLVLRRLAATTIDLGCVGLVVLLAVVVFWFGVGGVDVTSSAMGQLLGLATVTIPGVTLLSIAEATGGSPGKRVVGLRVVVEGSGRAGRWRVAGRTVAKYAVAWELGHAAVWRLALDEASAGTWVLLAGAYVLPVAAAAAVLVGRRPWFDLPVATRVERRLAP